MTKQQLQAEMRLKAAIDQLYSTFSRYSPSTLYLVDPCFPTRCDASPLRSRPLRDLPAEAFETFQWKAITTWARVEDYKYFLPRLLELSSQQITESQDLFGSIETWLIFSKLDYSQWRQWPSVEQRAIEDFVDCLWASVLHTPLECDDDGDWGYQSIAMSTLEAFAHALLNLQGQLDRWHALCGSEADGLSPSAHLAAALYFSAEELNSKKLVWYKFADLLEPAKQVSDFLISRRTAEIIESSFFQWPDSAQAQLFSYATSIATALRP